jgi:LCP family protein required for cell wall assembly
MADRGWRIPPNPGTLTTLSVVSTPMSSSSGSSSSAPRRGLPKWLKVTILSALVLANLIVLALVWALTTGRSFLAGANTDHDVVEVLTPSTNGSLTFLVVGSDSREGLDDLKNFGNFGGQRGDVVMLVRLDPSTGGATILSIPRDLWVDIPGHGKNKINAAYSFGGSVLMVQTIQQNLGVPVNHYVEVGFTGFIDMVDEIGGIEISFPYPARDLSSGLNVDAGDQLLDGGMALAYARSRKYHEMQNGSWVAVDADDIGRTTRQQAVIGAILAKLKTPGSIAEAGQIASALSQHMTIDASLASSSVAGLAWDFRGLVSGDIRGSTLPVDMATIGGASVVVAREPDATEAITAFLAGGELASAPIRIQVLNGNGVGGAAGRMSQVLEDAGFEVVSIGDAETSDYELTTVITSPGSDDGQAIVTRLGFGVVLIGDVDKRYDAIVIVGSDAA